MNKEKYIKEVDSVVPSPELNDRISKLPGTKKKKNKLAVAAIIAACFVFLIIIGPAAGAKLSDSVFDSINSSAVKAEDSYSTAESAYDSYDSSYDEADKDVNVDVRKITKTADIRVEVKVLDDFIRIIKDEVNKANGYVSSEDKSVYDSSSSCTLVIKVPAEKLDSFVDLIDANSTVTSQQVNSDDISAQYVDTEARIKSLEAEQESLLKLIEKADNLDSIIQLQKRLSEIRSDLDSYKSTKKIMDNQIEYSSITIYINEKERTVKNDGSFLSEVKEKFLNSVYSIGDFFRGFAIGILGGSPYIVIIAIVAVIVFKIYKKKNKKKSEKEE